MIEIIVLYTLCSKMGTILRNKGWSKPFWMQCAVVFIWLFGAFSGAIFYSIYITATQGEVAAQNLGFSVYPYSVLGAVVSQCVLFALITLFPNRNQHEAPVDMMTKHSRLGISSLVISLVAGYSYIYFSIDAFKMVNPATVGQKTFSPAVGGILLLFSLFLSFIGLCLGAGGIIQKRKKKISAIFGFVFSALPLVGAGFIAVLS